MIRIRTAYSDRIGLSEGLRFSSALVYFSAHMVARKGACKLQGTGMRSPCFFSVGLRVSDSDFRTYCVIVYLKGVT